MRRGRFVSGLCAGLIALALLVAGCGTSSPGAPSALNPARIAPAGSLVYVSLTVRPQGSQRAQMRAALHELSGASADRSIRSAVEQLLRRLGASYNGGVAPWLGQQVGFVVTQLPSAAVSSPSPDVALIAPTRNPAAARAFLQRLLARNPGTEGHVAGGYAVWGGALAYQAILATDPADSLASSRGYRATVSRLGGGTAALVYLNLHRFAKYTAAARSSAGGGALTPLIGSSLSRIGAHAALAAGLTLSPDEIRLDTVESGVRAADHGSPVGVGNLPAGSWLALTSDTGGSASSARKLAAEFQLGLSTALSQSGTGAGELPGALQSVERDLLPALGPMSLAIGGTSPLGLSAGLKLAPGDAAAATRLLRLLRTLAARTPALSVSGSATRFTVRVPTGSRLLVDQSRYGVVATYGFSSQASFLAPASNLSDNATYRQAVAQLPSGSHVPLYISFGPIASLLADVDHKPSAARTVRALQRLSYLIVGSSAGRERIVLGLR